MSPETLMEPDRPVNHPRSDQPQTYSLQERDLRLSHEAQLIEQALYRCLKIHACGAIDHIPDSAFPERTKTLLREIAQAGVMELAPDRTDLADVRAREHMRRFMEAEAIVVIRDVVRLIGGDRYVLATALQRFRDALLRCQTPNLSTECRAAFRESLVAPDTRSPLAQVVRGVLSTLYSGPAVFARGKCRSCSAILWTKLERTSGSCDGCITQYEARR